MINPTQVAAIVAGAMLSVCVFWTGLDQALAKPIAVSAEAAAGTGAAAAPREPQPPRGRVYLFRGALGPIFSRGMDRLTEQLADAGIKADVYEFTICRLIAAQAIRDYRDDPAPITLIGHSMGGLCALTFAEVLQDEDIPVNLVVTIDPAHASPKVPLNVGRYINIFLSTSILGGGDVVAEQGYRGHYASYDLSKQDEVTHINIDKMDSVHQQLISMIVQLATTPKMEEGETAPLRYVVPPGTPVELWDSGTPLLARSGDTLQKLAAFHHVPLWSLTQINQLPDTAPLTTGQRVIIPRHLMPASELPVQAPLQRQRAERNGTSIGVRRQ
jgi:predicted alpha/beta-hydrolase family hydrolase